MALRPLIVFLAFRVRVCVLIGFVSPQTLMVASAQLLSPVPVVEPNVNKLF